MTKEANSAGFPAALRAWVEQLRLEMFGYEASDHLATDQMRRQMAKDWKDSLARGLDVFATEWEKEHAVDRIVNRTMEGRVLAELRAERDALQVERDEAREQFDRHVVWSSEQLAAGDTARAALREQIEQAYREGFQDATQLAVSLDADVDVVDIEWNKSLSRSAKRTTS